MVCKLHENIAELATDPKEKNQYLKRTCRVAAKSRQISEELSSSSTSRSSKVDTGFLFVGYWEGNDSNEQFKNWLLKLGFVLLRESV